MQSKDPIFKTIFLIASVYDFILGFFFIFFYPVIFEIFNIALPVYPMYLQMAAAFVFAMGIAYFFVYKNMYRNIDLVKLGVVYKLIYSGITTYFYYTNQANILFFWFALVDIGFMMLFIWFLIYAVKDKR